MFEVDDLVFVLVFAVVLLFFSIYPAIKIVDFFDKTKRFDQKSYNILTIILTIIIALIGGIILKYL